MSRQHDRFGQPIVRRTVLRAAAAAAAAVAAGKLGIDAAEAQVAEPKFSVVNPKYLPLYQGDAGYFFNDPRWVKEAIPRLTWPKPGDRVPELGIIIPNNEPDWIDSFRKWSADAEQLGIKYNITQVSNARWLEMMHNNAEQALTMRRLARAGIESSLEDLREAFDLEEAPNRLECFDISHTGGTDTVASCVVFGVEGPLKSDYRRFNISGIQPGDDYAAMYQALTRRYKRVRDGEIVKPDVLLIDGGKGQLAEAAKVLDELGVGGITLIGVAKGVDRRAGQEQLFLLGQDTPTILPPDSRALHLIQRVRDEAHRFAIAGHRKKRAKRHSR